MAQIEEGVQFYKSEETVGLKSLQEAGESIVTGNCRRPVLLSVSEVFK